jgi:hypothetical protein
MCSAAMDRSNWPRRSYGRDAMWIRGPIALADYLPGRGFTVAREALGRVMPVPARGWLLHRPGRAGRIARLGKHGAQAVDELHGARADDGLAGTPSRRTRRSHADRPRIFDWQMQQLVRDEDDRLYWPYQVGWGDNDCRRRREQPHPTGRSELLVSRAGNALRGEALRRTALPAGVGGGHAGATRRPAPSRRSARRRRSHANKAIECVTWHQLRRWNARWIGGQAGGRSVHAARRVPARDHRDPRRPAGG